MERSGDRAGTQVPDLARLPAVCKGRSKPLSSGCPLRARHGDCKPSFHARTQHDSPEAPGTVAMVALENANKMETHCRVTCSCFLGSKGGVTARQVPLQCSLGDRWVLRTPCFALPGLELGPGLPGCWHLGRPQSMVTLLPSWGPRPPLTLPLTPLRAVPGMPSS